ncbi:hypothetical protein Pmani_011147 [Petrolisthes manimaculis]|uniref:Uncharacterized protein n=1 Tax=Petrolisthes manimaculis TaxID=1843537 RepID=A0AAE1UBT1_9EUCA|nr:hypothetical protein Pmani_011147 [Petrolisthes manimaculis]
MVRRESDKGQGYKTRKYSNDGDEEADRQTDKQVRMAERSKALRSGRSPVFRAWVRIPLLTDGFPPGPKRI